MVAIEEESMRLEVCDAGSGFVVVDAGDGFGLFSMEERALGLGGRLHVSSSPGEGTTVRLTCPVQVEGVSGREDTAAVPRRASMVGR